MCTAISYKTDDHYFGRNLDLEYHYDEEVTITPRNYPFRFRDGKVIENHHAIIGMATVVDGYPLYYDATNEHGLSIAGLNFPGNAVYHSPNPDKENVTPFELIPWILGKCKSTMDARQLLENANILNEPFRGTLPLSPLHWMISDRESSIVVEPMSDGLKVYDNPINVLTNNPPFPYHRDNLQNYMSLSPERPENKFAPHLPLQAYSTGMGAFGLPGDLSSASRFVRAAFNRNNAVCEPTEYESISQFFHILSSVEQQRGCSVVNGKYEITLYSSCCNTDRGIYYYTTYENRQICAIDLFKEDLVGDKVVGYPLINKQQIFPVN